MEREQIIATINKFLQDDFEVPEESIKPDSDLKTTLDLDSLDYVDLVVSIESNFGFKVKPEDFQQMLTLNDLYIYVEQQVNDKIVA
jgi:acyl carrier protein